MKKITVTVLAMICIMICFSSPVNSTEKKSQQDKDGDGYITSKEAYPSATALRATETKQEKIEMTTIDPSIIKSLSTANLVELVISYPYLGDMLAFDDYLTGCEVVIGNFNGLRELMNRKDAGDYLLDAYRKMSVSDSIVLSCLEILMAKFHSLKAISETQFKSFYDVYLQKNELRKSSGYSIRVNLEVENSTKATYYVLTPKGTKVKVTKNNTVPTAQDIADFNKLLNQYSGTRILGTYTFKYNCHSYAFYQQSTLNTYVMSDPSAYITDGSYKKRNDNSVTKGDIIVITYNKKISHSEVNLYNATHINIAIVKGKWGPGYLVEYNHQNSPFWSSGCTRAAYYR